MRRPEADFTRQVIEVAKLGGWLVHHSRPGLTRGGRWVTPLSGHAGLPDLILVHRKTGRVVFAELKVGDNEPSELQQDWLAALRRGPVEAVVWYPSDQAEIDRVLLGGGV